MINPELDISLLAFFRDRVKFYEYISFIDTTSLSKEAQNIIKGYDKYFNAHESVNYCAYHVFVPWFFNNCHADWLSDVQNHYRQVFSYITAIKDGDIGDIVKLVEYRSLCKKILTEMKILDYVETGKLNSIPIFDSIKLEQILNQFNSKEHKDVIDYGVNDLKTLYDEEQSVSDYAWSLKPLNIAMKGVPVKSFILFSSPHNNGKTAFAVSQAVHISKQLPEGAKVLYFNNEQRHLRIVERFYLAVLNKLSKKLVSLQYMKENGAQCVEKYKEYFDGDIDKIKIFNIKPYADKKCREYIEAMCKKYNPGFIVIDQIDNMLSSYAEENKKPYRELYEWCRSLAEKHATVLGLSQSKSAEYYDKFHKKTITREWLTASDLHWSNIDKQGASDVLITMGYAEGETHIKNFWIHRNKGGDENVRFSSVLYKDSVEFK